MAYRAELQSASDSTPPSITQTLLLTLEAAAVAVAVGTWVAAVAQVEEMATAHAQELVEGLDRPARTLHRLIFQTHMGVTSNQAAEAEAVSSPAQVALVAAAVGQTFMGVAEALVAERRQVASKRSEVLAALPITLVVSLPAVAVAEVSLRQIRAAVVGAQQEVICRTTAEPVLGEEEGEQSFSTAKP
jgi:hypothetical protein